jgi:hypothetical protein
VAKYEKNGGGFDRGAVPRYPDMAIIAKVTGIGEPISYDDDATTTFPIDILTAGTVPRDVRARPSIRLASAFLKPTFKRTELAGVKFGNASALWVFSSNIAESKYEEIEKDGEIVYKLDKNGDPIENNKVSHLYGFCGLDYKKYDKAQKALQGLWPDSAMSKAAIKQVLADFLTDNEVGFWVKQKQELIAEYEDEEGKKVQEWQPTRLFNIDTPKFVKSAYFKTDAKSRAYILSQVRSEKNVNRATGQPWRKATFDEATSF